MISHNVPILGITTYHIHASEFYHDKSSHYHQYPPLEIMYIYQ